MEEEDITIAENLIGNHGKDMTSVENSMENHEQDITIVEKSFHNHEEDMRNTEKSYGDGICNENKDDFSDYGHDKDNGRDGSEVKYDCEYFSRLLVNVPFSDIMLFSELAFLCNMAYMIPEIKANDLRRYYGLHFVTSSLEKKVETTKTEAKIEESLRLPITIPTPKESSSAKAKNSERKPPIHSSVASEIVAAAASYLWSRSKDLLPLGFKFQQESSSNDFATTLRESENQLEEEAETALQVSKTKEASYLAAATMTAIVKVPAVEKENQELSGDVEPFHSSPFEWFICDDPSIHTRFFVIQGPNSLASWQPILIFEPTIFEGKEVFVHAGIYEAAKVIYGQVMPKIVDHLQTHGDQAKLHFTGHSLGGSISVLVSLMLLTRNIIRPSTLQPVVTFGSPFVLCGGQKLFDELMLDDNQLCNVIIHRDIVPRLFSCNYPDYLTLILTLLNSSLRSHPCLIENKFLYSPLGKIFVLQPNEKSSPPHPLILPGTAIYALDKTNCGSYSSSAMRAFLNCPHPIETLLDPKAYGYEGTVSRDHDSSSYLRAINGVLRILKKMTVRRARKETSLLWPLLVSPFPRSWSHESNLEATS
ncbi:hypothetical protein REPUB_Repub15cG0085900 [Reevesia pubescens]